ncbi:MAG: toxin-antitoxin system, toxin component, partial [Clostridiaceae bacterium]
CLGYDDTLYKPLPTEKQYMTYGFYIQQADEAFRKGLISSGKYEELLLSAYRSDLVYGDESEGGELID